MQELNMEISGKQKRFLRGLGHHLKPVIMIGKDEINQKVITATDEALELHELIKIKLQEGCLTDRKTVAAELSEQTGSAVAQILGHTFLLYRPAQEPTIKLPV
jgi:RNA-binding protein